MQSASRTARLERSAALVLLCAGLAAGCNALLDIDDVEFGDGATGGAGAAAGTGGTATGSGTGGAPTGTHTGGMGLTGGSGTGGSGGPPPCPEICDDGVDNDGNDLTDCEDPCCSEWACIEAGFSDWGGPVAVYTGTDQGLTCTGLWPSTAVDGGTGTITAPDASCTGCSCSSPTGISCTANISFYPLASCAGSAYSSSLTGSCQAVPSASLLHSSARAATETATGGSCTASGGVATLQPATYETRTLLCDGATLGGGCSAGGQICTPPAPAGFDQTFCVYRNGNRNCSGLGVFTEKRSMNDELVDTRDCTSCTCSAPSQATCSGGTTRVYTPYTTSTCSGSSQTLNHDGSCDSLNGNPGRMDYTPGSASGGSCTASDSTPTGGAYDGGLLTLCCIPSN